MCTLDRILEMKWQHRGKLEAKVHLKEVSGLVYAWCLCTYQLRYVCGNTVKEVVPPEIRLANLDSL